MDMQSTKIVCKRRVCLPSMPVCRHGLQCGEIQANLGKRSLLVHPKDTGYEFDGAAVPFIHIASDLISLEHCGQIVSCCTHEARIGRKMPLIKHVHFLLPIMDASVQSSVSQELTLHSEYLICVCSVSILEQTFVVPVSAKGRRVGGRRHEGPAIVLRTSEKILLSHLS